MHDQVGALRDIKRDMALHRNSLHKQLVAEIEERVFVSVSGGVRAAAGGNASADNEDEDPDEAGSSSGSLSPSARLPTQALGRLPVAAGPHTAADKHGGKQDVMAGRDVSAWGGRVTPPRFVSCVWPCC